MSVKKKNLIWIAIGICIIISSLVLLVIIVDFDKFITGLIPFAIGIVGALIVGVKFGDMFDD
jgi:uncharacterized membrane protein